MKTTICHYQMDRLRIGFVKFILEGYDNVAVLSTLTSDPISGKAVVRIAVAPGCESLVTKILNELEAVFLMTDAQNPIALLSSDTKDNLTDSP